MNEEINNAKDSVSTDPFDPAKLRLSESSQIGVKKVTTVLPCGKPSRQQFVRVHPDESYRLHTAIFTDDVAREHYLVEQDLWGEMAGEVLPTILFAAITRSEGVFLWPVRVPEADGRRNNWHLSMMRAAERAMQRWIRVQANMADGRYDVFEATGNLPEPEWPEMTFHEMLKMCFEDRFINSLDHAVLKALRGEV